MNLELNIHVRRLLFLAALLAAGSHMVGCNAFLEYQLQPYHARKPRHYGHPSQPVTVTVQGGFESPGTYHLPNGTTLKTLLEKARLAEIVVESGLPDRNCWLQVTQKQGAKEVVWRSDGLPSEAELQMPLRDGAIIAVVNGTKWHL